MINLYFIIGFVFGLIWVYCDYYDEDEIRVSHIFIFMGIIIMCLLIWPLLMTMLLVVVVMDLIDKNPVVFRRRPKK